MTNSIAAFYGALFTVEFTVLGILFAAVFLFLQIIYQDRLFRFFNKTPWRKLVAIAIISSLSLLTTAIGFFLGAFPGVGWWTLTFSNNYFAFAVLILFFVSTIATISVAISEILSLQPMSLINAALKNVDMMQLRRFLISEYGVREPFLFRIVGLPIREQEEKEEVSAEDQEAIYKKDMAFYDELKAGARGASDPFSALNELALRAIQQRDGPLFANIIDAYRDILKKEDDIFVKPVDGGKWNPNGDLAEHMAEYLLKCISNWINECKREGGGWEFTLKAYKLTEELVSRSVSQKDGGRIVKILSFWKLEADKWATEDNIIYAYLIGLFADLENRVFSNQGDDFERQITDEVFRDFGWLMERLIAKRGVEVKPVMYDTEYTTPYEILFNAFISFSYQYNNYGASFYPLIFFDAVWALSNALLEIIGKDENEGRRQKIYENLFDCAFAYSQFSESAMRAGNGSGASLGAMDLRRLYDDLKEKPQLEEIEKVKRDVIGLMIGLAMMAAGREKKTISAEFMAEGIDEHLFKILVDIPASYNATFDSEVFEAFLKADKHYDHDAAKEFLKKLGRARGSTFGLNL